MIVQDWLRAQADDFAKDGHRLDVACDLALAALTKEYAVKVKQHRTIPRLVGLSYDMINSPMAEEIVQHCRGLILDTDADFEVVAWPFRKFFNHGEQLAAKIDWRTASVQEKVDGSLIIVYHYAGEWHAATTGTPDASGDVNGFGIIFADLFWKTLGMSRELFKGDKLDEGVTFMFELTTPMNKVVVQHKDSKVTFLGARWRDTGEEIPPHRSKVFEYVAPPKMYPLQTMDEVLKTLDVMKGTEQEEYVVCDAQFNRVKVKSPSYVALHHIKGSMSPRGMLEIVRKGERSEIAAHFPEWADQLQIIDWKYRDLCAEMMGEWDRIRKLMGAPFRPESVTADEVKAERKEFAVHAVKTRCPAVLFVMFSDGDMDPSTFFKAMPIDGLAKLLNLNPAAAISGQIEPS